MPKEIERKFLVTVLPDLTEYPKQEIRQGYLPAHAQGPIVRLRIQDENAFITLKGKATGITRDEYEYPIPRADAEELLATYCRGRELTKTRYRIPYHTYCIELDVFHGALDGLVLAEVELDLPQDPFTPPSFFGREVSEDWAYSNYKLVERAAKGVVHAS